MDSRSLLVVALALSVTLSGCSLLPGTGGDEGTPGVGDPVTVDGAGPTEGPRVTGERTRGTDDGRTRTATVTSPPYEPGDAIRNPGRLVRSHGRTVAAGSYRLRARINTSDSRGVTNQTITVASDPATRQVYTTLVEPGNRGFQYQNGSRLYSMRVRNGSREYRTRTVETPFRPIHRGGTLLGPLQAVLGAGNFTRTRTFRVDGRQLHEYTLADPSLGPGSDATVTRSAGRAVVSSEGVVFAASVDIRGRQNGSAFVYDLSYRVTGLGNVSVREPGWVQQARERAAE